MKSRGTCDLCREEPDDPSLWVCAKCQATHDVTAAELRELRAYKRAWERCRDELEARDRVGIMLGHRGMREAILAEELARKDEP